MNPQERAWKTRKKTNMCSVCNKKPISSKNAKTCSRKCAAKLAWITGKQKED